MKLDRQSAMPLYHQIAEGLRYRIATGKTRPGDRLPSVRQAARQWGVNLHTVRRAYHALEESGLLHTDRAGTVVRERLPRAEALEAFQESVVRRASDDFDLLLPDLQKCLALHGGTGGAPAVHVMECSESQAADLAAQVTSAWDVLADPWSLDRPGEPPEGPLMATYFHYNDIRTRWPGRFPSVHFIAIHPDPTLAWRLAELQPRGGTILLCERDERMASNIGADLSGLLPAGSLLRTVVTQDPERALQQSQAGDVMLFGPRMWGALGSAARADRRAVEVRYLVDGGDLALVADRMGWRRSHGEKTRRARASHRLVETAGDMRRDA